MAEYQSPSVYTVVVNNHQLNHFQGMSISRSMSSFMDQFDIRFGNKGNETSTKLYLGDRLEFRRNNREVIFTGIIEEKGTTIEDTNMRLRVSGRDSIVDLLETKAPFQTFKNVTDNVVIEKVIRSVTSDFSLDLGEAKSIPEYSIGPGDTVASVIDGVAKQNGYFIWKVGNTIVKRKVAESGLPVFKYVVGPLAFGENTIESWSTSESIANAKSKIEGYTQSGGRGKDTIFLSKDVPMFQSSDYQRTLRNRGGHGGSNARVNRVHAIGLASKNQGDAQREIEMAMKAAQTASSITIRVKGFPDHELNDIITVVNLYEDVEGDFVLTAITYDIDENSKATSTLTFQPLGSYPQ